MRKFTAALLASGGILALAAFAPAQAITCNTTQQLGQAGTSDLAGLSGGNCVQVSDKIFGDASVGGAITGQQGNAIFTFTPTSVTVGFQGAVGPTQTGNINYSVAVAPGFNFVITSVAEDFTLTGDGGILPGSATLDGTANGEVSTAPGRPLAHQPAPRPWRWPRSPAC